MTQQDAIETARLIDAVRRGLFPERKIDRVDAVLCEDDRTVSIEFYSGEASWRVGYELPAPIPPDAFDHRAAAAEFAEAVA